MSNIQAPIVKPNENLCLGYATDPQGNTKVRPVLGCVNRSYYIWDYYPDNQTFSYVSGPSGTCLASEDDGNLNLKQCDDTTQQKWTVVSENYQIRDSNDRCLTWFPGSGNVHTDNPPTIKMIPCESGRQDQFWY